MSLPADKMVCKVGVPTTFRVVCLTYGSIPVENCDWADWGFRTSHFKLIIELLWLCAAEIYAECSFDKVDKNIAEKNMFCVSACCSKSYIRTVYTEHYWCLHKCSYYQWHVRLCSPISSLMLALSCVLIINWMDEYSKSKIVCLHNNLLSYLYLWPCVQVEGTASSKGLLGSPLKIGCGS